MPLRGSGHTSQVLDEDPYFESLSSLDGWAARPVSQLAGVLRYYPRTPVSEQCNSRGKLLVRLKVDTPKRRLRCHIPSISGRTVIHSSSEPRAIFRSYIATCVSWLSFSHHRVTVPPSGWTTAAHRHGVKMLGTLIFEGSGEEDCLRLLVGRLPQSRTGPAAHSSTASFPVSPHYARIFAELAFQRGFDGYLLNFECPLRGGLEQARALTAWITLLESELRRKVGPHAQVIWYDSVIINGQLRWQDRLNSYNLPFFLPSSGFFTNYTWPPQYPSLTAQYFLSLDPSLTSQPKSLKEIFVGVDVWGRGSHGGGGFGCYKAISHIDPEFLGLSVALFGQAWTWETEQDKPGWCWEAWWEYDRKLWLGPPNAEETVLIPKENLHEGQPECPHGPFVPITQFFPRYPPPDPALLPFFTTFSPGVGRAWFVNGVKVLDTSSGWTDLSKNCSLGDMVWPRPTPHWDNDEHDVDIPEATTTLLTNEAWLGGSSLQMTLSITGSTADNAAFRCLRVPVQSFSISPRITYEMSLVYRVTANAEIDIDLGLSVEPQDGSSTPAVSVSPIANRDPAEALGAWSRLTVEFSLPSDSHRGLVVASGLILGLLTEDPTQDVQLSIQLGALSVYPRSSIPRITKQHPRLIWADFKVHSAYSQERFCGILNWEAAEWFEPLSNLKISSPEDPQSAWVLESLVPSFSFFNIYAEAVAPEGHGASDPARSVFIGTTGLDGHERRFFVDPACLPPRLKEADTVRFYVQGVTAEGCVLDWESCVFVEVDKPQ
ncbi:glycoside hydrolase family 85 protein [Gelatoporia subvermispora B]|uniref:Glycoside hydrolase family 85 protein n=1 Tax=Ceriporiopsis subvermispora (strain B) TaxID=914234 RepID=M2RQH8_CERS8|nr:glycoside hydrolase family 85 protein [Gelatoporia subvermispora B]